MKSLVITLLAFTTITLAAPFAHGAGMFSFQCPENIPTEQKQKKALSDFINWAMQKYPNITTEQFVALRLEMLEKNKCAKTLASIKSNESPEASNNRYQCLKGNGSLYFSSVGGEECQSVPLEADWVNFRVEPDLIVDIIPSKVVKEIDGTKIWSQYYLAQVASSSDGAWKYNYVKSVTKYFCKTKQQLLIQGVYYLNGEIQHERLSNESIIEEIEPGTISELILDYACK
ncbi:MAG: hypothetical protein HOO95_10145 [Gallionella sp.]|nr:hypothetical protein [Gallionella sp.]